MKKALLLLPTLFSLQFCLAAEPRTHTVSGFDSAALNRAIAAAQAGDTVQLPEGTYALTEAIAPRSGTHLIGAGQDKTIIHYAGAKQSVMIALNDCEDCEIANLTLDAQGNENVSQGIAGGNSRRLKLHHLTIRNLVKSKAFGPHAVLFNGNKQYERGVTDSEVTDCLIENIALDAKFGCAIRFSWGSSRNKILRNTIRNTGRGGIFGDNKSADLIIQNNTVTGSGGEGLGIEVWEGCDRSVIEDNKIDHWLSIGGADYCAVRRNVVSDKSGTVKFIGIEGIGAHCVYTDNVVDDGQQIGLSVSNIYVKDDCYWANNTVGRCIQWGAQFQGEKPGIARHYFYRCKFTHNTAGRGKPIYPNDAGHAFRFNGETRKCVFEECEFSDNDGYGIQFGGGSLDGFTFQKCMIRQNKREAMVGLKDYSALEWIDCKIEGNKSDEVRPAKPFPHAAPVAAFDAPAKARAGEAIQFASSSRAAEGKIVSVLWDFGDGAPSSDATATHTYAQPGEYRVTLIAWDEAGRGARAEKTVRVEK
ncbi:MAG TPA: PKD domain-containing protein [Planctomycetota bacterium]|jgi:hypothetical protein